MNCEKAVHMIDDLVFAKAGRHLDHAERLIIKASWLDLDYKEIAEKSPYTVDRLQRDIGRKLWILLTGIMGNGEKVTKKRLRAILEQRMPLPGNHPLDSEDSSKISVIGQLQPDNTLPHILGGQFPDISSFYGRGSELAMLKKAIVENRCVALIGVAGIGKSAIAAKLLDCVHAGPGVEFEYIILKSISYAPLLTELVSDLLKLLTEVSELDLPETEQGQISVLISFFQTHRCLLVLDAAEAVLQGDRNTSLNPYGEKYADYGVFIRRLVEGKHESCLMLNSREPFNDINKLQRSRRANCCSIKLEGLDSTAARKILKAKGLTDEHRWDDLIEFYLGNPEAIEIAASRIKDFFNGSVADSLNYRTTVGYEIFREALAQQFCNPGRLTYLEKQIMLYLADKVVEFPNSLILFSSLLEELKILAKNSVSVSGLIEALTALHERSLIELCKNKETGELFIGLKNIVRRCVPKEKKVVLVESPHSLGWNDQPVGLLV